MADLRAAVTAAGGRERDVTAIAAAAVRREGRSGPHGPCATVLLQHAALRLRYGVAIPTVLKDLKR